MGVGQLVERMVELLAGMLAGMLAAAAGDSGSGTAAHHIVADERRWSSSVRWHWLTFRDYFDSGRDSYRASSACAYEWRSEDSEGGEGGEGGEGREGSGGSGSSEGAGRRWQEKRGVDVCSDVHMALAHMEGWLQRVQRVQRAQRGGGGGAGEDEEQQVQGLRPKAAWQWVNEWAESQQRTLTFHCWVALLGVSRQRHTPHSHSRSHSHSHAHTYSLIHSHARMRHSSSREAAGGSGSSSNSWYMQHAELTLVLMCACDVCGV